MTRLEQIKELMTANNPKLSRLACTFMTDATLHYLLEVDQDTPVNNLIEPFRTDVINSFKIARNELNQ